MSTVRFGPHIFLIDLKPGGFSHFIASYVIKAEKVAIVESGPVVTLPNLLAGLRTINVSTKDVDYVAVSHVHLDHGGGAAKLLGYLPNAKLVVHKRGVPHMANPERLWTQARQVLGKVAELYEKPVAVAEERIVAAEDGMVLDLGEGVELMVLETLGHASHHQSLYEKASRGVFPGDAAGIYIPEFDVIIPTTPPPLRLEAALASIEKLKQLKPEVIYYSHFGKANNALEKLKTHADQLKLWAEIVTEKIRDEATLEEMKEEIERRDPALSKVKGYLATHPILSRGAIIQSIQGFEGYLKAKTP